MKEWWHNLSLREKQTISLGTIVVLLFLLYEIIWSPFTQKIDSLRNEVQHNQKLLGWMQTADQQLLEAAQTAHAKETFSGSLLSIIQNQLNKNPLGRHLTQLRQVDNDGVQFGLQKASFNELISFLTALWQQYDIVITQIAVTPTGTPGEVTTEIILKPSG